MSDKSERGNASNEPERRHPSASEDSSGLGEGQTPRHLTEKRGGYPGTTPVDQMQPPPDNNAPGEKPGADPAQQDTDG